MIFVWFIYGLAFFALGLAILIYPKEDSRFRLARHIWMIGVFGIVHGINEWLDMFYAIGKPFPPDLVDNARMLTLLGSFLFLLQFGITMVWRDCGKHRLVRLFPLSLVGAWLIVFFWTSGRQDRLLMGDIWARYLVCAPGALLTAWGLFSERAAFRSMRQPSVIRNLTAAAAIFLVYGGLAGLCVKKADFFPASVLNYDSFRAATGFPVQVFRAFCAMGAAWSIICLLEVFRWETRENLRISDLRCATIASTMPVFLFMTDHDLVFTFVEGKGLEVLGLEPDRVRGRRTADVFPSNADFTENCRRALEGQAVSAAVSIGGMPFDVYYCALRDLAGEVSHVVGVALDVSARVKARQEVEEYRRQMEKYARDAEVGVLSEMMGRQIAEPLSIALLMLEKANVEMAEAGLSDAGRRAIGKGVAEVFKANETLTRFLQMTHPAPAVAEQPIPLFQIARRITGMFAESAQRKRMTIAVEEMEVIPFMAVSQREIEQIFYQLIQWALEAIGGGVEHKLAISCSASDGQIELTFSYSRSGDLPQPVPQAELPGLSGIDGEALGLAIVRQIVASHGGQTVVETQQGGVVVFRVRLPATRVC